MKDINSYIQLMEKAMREKLFFLDKLDISSYDYIIDFGCANGVLLQLIYKDCNTKFIGYDISEEMINLAKKGQQSLMKNLHFTSNLEEILNLNGKTLIILSSVLHENEKNNISFESTVNFLKNFDTIVIRDMYFDDSLNKKLSNDIRIDLQNKLKPYIFNEFEEKYGKIESLKQYYHLLLKYDYEKNWKNEILEDYFSFNFKSLIEKFKSFNYSVLYFNHIALQFHKDKIKKDLNINFNLPTHLYLILKRN